MSENRDYGFCPRCGALMRDGVCSSCGYTSRPSAQPNVPGGAGQGQAAQGNPGQQPYGTAGQPYMQGTPYVQAQERKKSKKGLFIALGVIAGVLLLIGLILAIVFFGQAVGRAVSLEQESSNDSYDDYYDDGYYDDYYDDYEYYEPSEDDPYYREIVDSTRTDLDYGISWIVDSITPDDVEDYCTYYSTYPLLTGGDGAYDAVNDTIAGKALEYKDTYSDYAGGCTTYGYVTYMDETRISVVFQHSIYEETQTIPRVSALTFDLETGQEITPDQMTEIDDELVMRFRSQNETQNGSIEFIDNASDEELLALLQDPDQNIFFYSPVGLEAGFNYDSEEYGGGWVTVTLKDLAL